MAQWLKACVSLAEDWGLFPSTHIKKLTSACDSSSGGI